jgi:hypothetical protein
VRSYYYIFTIEFGVFMMVAPPTRANHVCPLADLADPPHPHSLHNGEIAQSDKDSSRCEDEGRLL